MKGIIPSKKNEFFARNNVPLTIQRAIHEHGYSKEAMAYVKKNVKSWITGTKRYIDWCEAINEEIMRQAEFWRNKYDLTYPLNMVSIKTYYYFADLLHRDLVNKDESILDMLVLKGIISDDRYDVVYKTSSEGACYKDQLSEQVTTVDITIAIF